MTSKNVTTSIDKELWVEAQHNDVPWSKALTIGIEFLLDKKSDRGEEKRRLEKKREYYERQIKEIEEAENMEREEAEKVKQMAEKRHKFIEDNREILLRAYRTLERNGGQIGSIYYIWESFNKRCYEETGKGIQQQEFIELCKAVSKNDKAITRL